MKSTVSHLDLALWVKGQHNNICMSAVSSRIDFIDFFVYLYQSGQSGYYMVIFRIFIIFEVILLDQFAMVASNEPFGMEWGGDHCILNPSSGVKIYYIKYITILVLGI